MFEVPLHRADEEESEDFIPELAGECVESVGETWMGRFCTEAIVAPQGFDVGLGYATLGRGWGWMEDCRGSPIMLLLAFVVGDG